MSKFNKWVLAFILLSSLFYVQPTSYANTGSVQVATKSLNMRTGPGLTYEVTGSLKMGDQLDVISTSGDWLEVSHNGHSGWIASWLTAGNNTTEVSNTMIVSRVDQLNVRSGPSVSSAVINRISAGESAMMTGQQNEWISINFKGTNGWVHSDYITQSTEKNQPASPVQNVSKDERFIVSVDGLNVRKKADLTSKIVDLIYRDESYSVLETEGNWVQIALNNNKKGWVYSFHGTLTTNSSTISEATSKGQVTILTNGTNIREAATTSSQIVLRADAGEKYSVINETGDWYEILIPSGGSAFVANWVVTTNDTIPTTSSNEQKNKRVPGTLKGLTIVVDPGHGGNDRGTTGTQGTDEKNITLLTAELLTSKLKAAGANVIITRESDTYVSLRKRVSISNQQKADAFISVHYDANPDNSIAGFTTYYTHNYQKALATSINNGLASTVNLRNRGAQPENYLVLRENKVPAVLIELGFLSNATEERTVTTEMFREQASQGIYKGLLAYFDTIDE